MVFGRKRDKQESLDEPIEVDTGELHTVERQPVATDTGEVHTVERPPTPTDTGRVHTVEAMRTNARGHRVPVEVDTGEVHTVERQPVETDTGEVHTVRDRRGRRELETVKQELREAGHRAKNEIRKRALPTREEMIENSKKKQEVLKERATEAKLQENISASRRKIQTNRQLEQKARRATNGDYFGLPDPIGFLGMGKKSGGGFGGDSKGFDLLNMGGGPGGKGGGFDLLNMGSKGGGGGGFDPAGFLNMGGSGVPGAPAIDSNTFFFGRRSNGSPGGPLSGNATDVNEFYFGNGGGGGSGGKKGKGGSKTGNPFTDMYGL